jgi:predicted Zn-dependent peptidase
MTRRLRWSLRAAAAAALFLALWSGPTPSAAEPAAAAAAAPAPALDVKEIRLENGLRIFVLRRTASPTFAGIYQFKVGSALDPKGRSGIAHLLEHMMFKGTRAVGTLDPEREAPLMERLAQLWRDLDAEIDKEDAPFEEPDRRRMEELRAEIDRLTAEQKGLIVKNEYDELMSRAGAVSLNAFTNQDVTTYLLQLPSNRLEVWFRLESDRLLNPVFREFYSERDVVQEERRQSRDNTPGGRVSEALASLMFTAHPYGAPVVGWPRDLQRLQADDAMEYFRTYYSPTNCVMVLAGDVTVEEVERLARKHLTAWRRRELPRLPITAEPEQKGERRRIVEFDAQPRLALGWLTAPEGHVDQYALDVLGAILGGLWSSRLDRTVVQQERIAESVYAGHSPLLHGGWFTAGGRPTEGHTTAELEAAVEREIRKIQDAGVTPEELARAKVQVEVSRVRSLKSNLGQAFRIADAVTSSGGTAYLREYEERVNAVTAEQVRDVASRYLKPSRKSAVELRKTPAEAAPPGAGFAHQRGAEPGRRGARHSAGFAETMALIKGAAPITLAVPEVGRDVDRVKLPGGTIVFIKEDRSAPSVEMSLAWLGGANTAPLEVLPSFELAGDLLNEGGTESLDPFAFEDRKEELGVQFGVYLGATEAGASFWSLRRNFPEAFDLALDVLMRPRLDAERLRTLKGQYVERMRRRGESASGGAGLIEEHLFNGGHPRLGFVASRAQIEAVTPDAVRAIWRRHLGRDNLYVTVVGDFSKKEMLGLVEKKLASWRKAEEKTRKFIARDPVEKPGAFLVEHEFPQPAVRVAHMMAVDRTAPPEDHAALEILNEILGGAGFRSRLMERLRSDEGLTYGIYSGITHEGRPGVPGTLEIAYQTKKGSVARSLESVMEEFRLLIRDGVSAEEVQEQIDGWRNRFVFRYTNEFFSVSRLMFNELDDRPYDHDRRELEAIQKVTPEDVARVARRYLKPDTVTVSIYGTLTEEDRKTLEERLGLKLLREEEVFKGGYEEPAEPKALRPAA